MLKFIQFYTTVCVDSNILLRATDPAIVDQKAMKSLSRHDSKFFLAQHKVLPAINETDRVFSNVFCTSFSLNNEVISL